MFFGRKKLRAREFVLEDDQGRERVVLKTDQDGNTVTNFLDNNGVVRMFMGLTPDGTPRVCLTYADGKGSIQLEANDRLNSAAVIIAGPKGKAQVILGVSANGLPAIALLDEEGNRLFPLEAQQPPPEKVRKAGGFDWDDLLRC